MFRNVVPHSKCNEWAERVYGRLYCLRRSGSDLMRVALKVTARKRVLIIKTNMIWVRTISVGIVVYQFVSIAREVKVLITLRFSANYISILPDKWWTLTVQTFSVLGFLFRWFPFFFVLLCLNKINYWPCSILFELNSESCDSFIRV